MKNSFRRPILCAVLILGTLTAAEVPQRYRPVTSRIRAQSLKGRLSFLASDALEGRATPSRGLDIAAEYIASEFRRAGLEPAGGDGYFQTAKWLLIRPDKRGLLVRLDAAGRSFTLAPDRVEARLAGAMELDREPVVYIDAAAPEGWGELSAADVAGKVVAIGGVSRIGNLPAARRLAARRRLGALREMLHRAAPRLILDAGYTTAARSGDEILLDPELPPAIEAPEASGFFSPLPSRAAGITLTLHIARPESRPVVLRNVAALLKGSDAELSKTYVLLSAHYDHLGTKPEGAGDRIYNGADDDGSGVVSVLEIASALARSGSRPRRSILFITYFGEELGLLGSKYYAQHPLVPLEQTVANINIEQVGRTDDTIRPRINEATFTGFDYSTLVPVFVEAGKLTGIKVDSYQEPASDRPAGDPFFARSDNFPLARRGVVAHTVCVALEFPDYHLVSDDWSKLDYSNMARVDRMIAVGLVMIADSGTAPEWNRLNPETAPYRR